MTGDFVSQHQVEVMEGYGGYLDTYFKHAIAYYVAAEVGGKFADPAVAFKNIKAVAPAGKLYSDKPGVKDYAYWVKDCSGPREEQVFNFAGYMADETHEVLTTNQRPYQGHVEEEFYLPKDRVAESRLRKAENAKEKTSQSHIGGGFDVNADVSATASVGPVSVGSGMAASGGFSAGKSKASSASFATSQEDTTSHFQELGGVFLPMPAYPGKITSYTLKIGPVYCSWKQDDDVAIEGNVVFHFNKSITLNEVRGPNNFHQVSVVTLLELLSGKNSSLYEDNHHQFVFPEDGDGNVVVWKRGRKKDSGYSERIWFDPNLIDMPPRQVVKKTAKTKRAGKKAAGFKSHTTVGSTIRRVGSASASAKRRLPSRAVACALVDPLLESERGFQVLSRSLFNEHDELVQIPVDLEESAQSMEKPTIVKTEDGFYILCETDDLARSLTRSYIWPKEVDFHDLEMTCGLVRYDQSQNGFESIPSQQRSLVDESFSFEDLGESTFKGNKIFSTGDLNKLFSGEIPRKWKLELGLGGRVEFNPRTLEELEIDAREVAQRMKRKPMNVRVYPASQGGMFGGGGQSNLQYFDYKPQP